MYFDRFDVLSAHYLYWSENHTGQFSDGYERLCRCLKHFKPSVMFDYDSLSDNGKQIYSNLELKYIS